MACVTPLDGIPNTRRDDAPHMLTARAQRTLEAIDGRTLDEMRALRDETERFMLRYKFGMDEVITKLSILREEFNQTHDYNPIEHISSRLKSLDSVIAKMQRKGIEPTFDTIRETDHRHRRRARDVQLRVATPTDSPSCSRRSATSA